MPPKGKGKDKGKNGKATIQFDTSVPKYRVEVTQVQTALGLLESPEESLLILSTCAIDNFISKYGKVALVFLQDLDVLRKLIDNLQKHPTVRLLSLKLIVKLFQLEKTLPSIQLEKRYIDNLTNTLLAAEDVIEIEYIAYVLGLVCEEEKAAVHLVREEVIDKIFKNLVFYVDEDIKRNCLKVLLGIVSCYEARQNIAPSQCLQMEILHKIIEGPYPNLMPMAVKVIQAVTDWEYPAFQKKLVDIDTIQYLFKVLCGEKWTNAHNDALSAVYNCLKYNPVQKTCLESKVFLNFVNISRKSSRDHALACMALIQNLIGEEGNIQIMMDYEIQKQLADLCRFDDDLIYVQFCDVIRIFCQNCYVIPTLANYTSIKQIERLMRKKHLPWLPYRQAGIRPLHMFLMSDPKLTLTFFQTGVLFQIMDAVISREDLDEFDYRMVLQMYQSLACSKALHSYMWNEEICTQFVKMLSDSNPDVALIAFDVLQRTFYSEKYRQWFLDNDGFEPVSQRLCQRNCRFIDRVIAFCKFAAKYEEFCYVLMRKGFIPVLEDIGIGFSRQKSICDSIVNDIYRCELSIKFFKKSFLGSDDNIKNGFCMYANFRPRNFPPLAVDDIDKLCFTCTMLTVNFHGKTRIKVPVAIKEVTEVVGSAHSLDSGELILESNEKPTLKEIIYKKLLPEAEGDPKTDYYLKIYLKKIKKLMEKDTNPSFPRNISILAKFVVRCLSGYDKALPTKHQYETHIVELKKKLRSNYIPLGYIRIGTMIERALLFKVLADRLGIPCSLRRECDYCIWNEVTLYSNTLNCNYPTMSFNQVSECIVDLMCDVGRLLLKGEYITLMYCKNSKEYQHAISAENSMHTCESDTNTSNQTYPDLPIYETYNDPDEELREDENEEEFEETDFEYFQAEYMPENYMTSQSSENDTSYKTSDDYINYKPDEDLPTYKTDLDVPPCSMSEDY